MKLEIKDIGKKYHKNWLFRHLYFSLNTGESMGITGNNGSGKSTLLQIICGVVKSNEGQVLLNQDSTDSQGKLIAISAPYLELPWEFTISEIHQFYLDTGKMNSKLEEFLDLSEFSMAQSNAPIKHFSSGMKQRLKNSLAFCSNSPLILLDEPCTNLDKAGEQWYEKMVLNLREKIIVVAGNQKTEYQMTNRLLTLNIKST